MFNFVYFTQVPGWRLKVRLYYQFFTSVAPAHLLLMKFCEKGETHVSSIYFKTAIPQLASSKHLLVCKCAVGKAVSLTLFSQELPLKGTGRRQRSGFQMDFPLYICAAFLALLTSAKKRCIKQQTYMAILNKGKFSTLCRRHFLRFQAFGVLLAV